MGDSQAPIVLSLAALVLIGSAACSRPVDVTVYPVTTRPNGRTLPLNPSVYRIDVMAQTVIHWTPGVDEAPTALSKCAIRDPQNWRCEYSDGSGTVEMQGGKYREIGRSGIEASHTRYVTRTEWERAQSEWR